MLSHIPRRSSRSGDESTRAPTAALSPFFSALTSSRPGFAAAGAAVPIAGTSAPPPTVKLLEAAAESADVLCASAVEAGGGTDAAPTLFGTSEAGFGGGGATRSPRAELDEQPMGPTDRAAVGERTTDLKYSPQPPHRRVCVRALTVRCERCPRKILKEEKRCSGMPRPAGSPSSSMG